MRENETAKYFIQLFYLGNYIGEYKGDENKPTGAYINFNLTIYKIGWMPILFVNRKRKIQC